MSANVSVSMQELLAWNDETSHFWKAHLDANPALLQLPCGISGAATVQDFVRHIWGAELRWAQRLTGAPETPREALPLGPLDALFDLHVEAVGLFKGVLANPGEDWGALYTLDAAWLPTDKRSFTRRKAFAHAMFHGQRHWAQLASLVRQAGSPSGFRGDLLFSSSLP